MKTKKNTNVVMFTLMERIWHWVQAFSMVMLALSGISMHWPGAIFGMDKAYKIHNLFGIIVTVNFVVWLIYMLVSKRIHYYLPKKEDEYPLSIFKQAKFYIADIYFTNEHPYHVGPKNRMNPMQKVTYVNIMFIFMPAQMITGFMLLKGSASVHTALLVHLLLGAFFVLFIFGHMYLATTGHNPTALFKEMIHGYEEEPADEK
jgi:thiosulfate reductase cytochrome b subunit